MFSLFVNSYVDTYVDTNGLASNCTFTPYPSTHVLANILTITVVVIIGNYDTNMAPKRYKTMFESNDNKRENFCINNNNNNNNNVIKMNA